MSLDLQAILFDTSNPVPAPNYKAFGIQDLESMLKQSIDMAEKNIQAIENNTKNPTFSNTIRALDEATIHYNRVRLIVSHYSIQNATPEFNELFKETLSPLKTKFFYRIIGSKKLFDRIKSVKNSVGNNSLANDEKVLLNKTYDAFVNDGALLSEEHKKKLEKLTNKLSDLSATFRDNITRATNDTYIHVNSQDDLNGIPQDVIDRAKKRADGQDHKGWVFDLQPSDSFEILANAKNRNLREEMWRAFSTRCNNGQFDNNAILKELANIRKQSANLKGFDTHGDYAMDDRMLESPKAVIDFVEEMYPYAIDAAKGEIDELSDFVKNHDGLETMEPWDIAYYSKIHTKQNYDYDSNDMKPYLELESVKNGLFGLLKDLYGISFVQNDNYSKLSDQKDIVTYDVYDEDGSIIGNLAMDFFARDHKKVGAWAHEIANHYQTVDGSTNLPVADINLNILKPNKGYPILLTMDQTKTIYHEIGHALHALLSESRFTSLSGTSVAWDFVELPSQIMENWLDDVEYFQSVATHHETGEKIPLSLLEAREKSQKSGNAISIIKRLQLIEIDLAWNYYTPSSDASAYEIEKSIKDRANLMPSHDETRTAAFAHIFAGGYACGYYSYLWSSVLDTAAFKVFEDAGLRNREVGQKFRDEILSKGSTVEPLTLFENFTGKSPDTRALLENRGLVTKNSIKPARTPALG